MAPIRIDQPRDRWEEDGYFLTQQFRLEAPARPIDAMAVVREADACVKERTRAAGLGTTRWDGDKLMLVRICLLHLGALESQTIPDVAAAAHRAILGGLMVGRPGGSMWYRANREGSELVLLVGLSGLVPRLPRLAFRAIHAPLHRMTVRRAVSDLASRLSGA
jgi:hypothetical protein